MSENLKIVALGLVMVTVGAATVWYIKPSADERYDRCVVTALAGVSDIQVARIIRKHCADLHGVEELR